MQPHSITIGSGRPEFSNKQRFHIMHTTMRYIIFLLALLIPLSQAGASPESDFANWMAKATAGDAASQEKVGEAYYRGVGVKQNLNEAFAWLVKAAEQNDIHAQMGVAYFYSNGAVVAKDETAAFNWYIKAAQLGDPVAMRLVAERYRQGTGVSVNYEKSAEWFQKSAFHGDKESKSCLAYCYLTGAGVPKDPQQALALFLDSADLAPSRFLISYFYANGVVVTQDKAKAYMWCLLATEIDSNNTQYTKELEKLKSGLTDAQIIHATKAAAENKQVMVDGNQQCQGLTVAYLNKKNAHLPFHLESGAIIVPLQVSGLGEIYFLIDTGSQFSGIAQRTAEKLKLKSNDYIAVSGIGAKTSLARIAYDITLSTPELAFEKTSLMLLPDFDLDEMYGTPIGGILGMDVLSKTVVSINYTEKTITLSSPDAFEPKTDFTQIPLLLDRNLPYIEAQVINNGVRASGYFLLDTGANGCVYLTKCFQNIFPELKFKTLAANGSSGIGGVMPTIETRSQGVQVGSLVLSGPAVSLDQNTQGTHPNLVGGFMGVELLSRFEVILDAPHKSLYLKPNKTCSLPFPANAISGFGYKALRDDYKTVVVHTVIPGSPADKAGIKPEDVIAKINGQTTSVITLSGIYASLHKPQTHRLVVKRGTELINIKLEPIVIR